MSRRSEALHTQVMVQLLQTLLPPHSYNRWQDGTEAIDGVYLAAADTIHVDSHRREWQEGWEDLKQIRRRVIIRVEVEETELDQ